MVVHNRNFVGERASNSWRPVTPAFLAQNDLAVQHYGVPNGAHFWCKGNGGLWWFGKISASTTTDGVYLVRFLDDPGPIKLTRPAVRYTTSTGAVRGSWCLEVHLASAFAPGVRRNVDESQGAAVDS